MNVIVHCPKTQQGAEALRRRVAQVHAAAVVDRVGRLDCSKEQRVQLIASVQRARPAAEPPDPQGPKSAPDRELQNGLTAGS